MNQRNKPITFKKSVNKPDNKQIGNPQKEKIIKKLMEKFNITSEEAEKILVKLEQDAPKKYDNNNAKKQETMKTQQNAPLKTKVNESVPSKNKAVKTKSEIINSNENNLIKNKNLPPKLQKRENVEVITPQHHLDQKPTQKQQTKKQEKPTQKQQTKKQEKPTQKQQTKKQEKPTQKQQTKKQENVDDILTEIIPNYNQQIAVELNHADLTFESELEKIETLKESFINFVKRKNKNKLAIHALNDVSFKIYQGERVGIIGYNGAGKSTLLKVIAGIYPPDSGEIKVNGMISPLLSLGSGFDRNYSGRKNIMLNGAVLGYDKKFLESKIDEIIEFSELGRYIDLPIKNYSSGMLAKLGFSIATILDPDILIIDEILGVGDINFRKKSMDKMRSLIDSGSTLIFVSHSIPQVRELCDKAIWLENGKVKEIGEVNKVCEHYIKNSEKATNEQLANIELR